MLLCPAFGNGQNISDRGVKSTLACVYAGSLIKNQKKKKKKKKYMLLQPVGEQGKRNCVLSNTNSFCFRMQTEQSFINNLTSVYKLDKHVHLMEMTYDKFIMK